MSYLRPSALSTYYPRPFLSHSLPRTLVDVKFYSSIAGKGSFAGEGDMEKPKDNTHIERTSTQFRQRGFFLTQIERVTPATPSVRLIDLRILQPRTRHLDGLPNHHCEDPNSFTFEPGQWIDTYVPHLPKPGGFSFISTPKTFHDKGIASLAIQSTDNPPSKWLWQNGIVGQYVIIRVGGNFTFPPQPPAPELANIRCLQFIAGGVGVNPLISMLQFVSEENVISHDTRIIVHYLVRRQEETLFLNEISKVKTQFKNRFDGHLWITRQDTAKSFMQEDVLKVHRKFACTESEIGQTWNWWDSFQEMVLANLDTPEERRSRLVYICGPQGLTDRLVRLYHDRGMSTEDGQVQVEKWW